MTPTVQWVSTDQVPNSLHSLLRVRSGSVIFTVTA